MPAKNKTEGCLYVVATPIGNMDDITIRALTLLGSADLIAAEDTRKTGLLLTHHHIKGKLVSCHEHNEKKRVPELIGKIKGGASVALVSDAGTPSVSDPGYRLVEAAIARDIKVVPVPGVSAVITALSVAGLPTDAFVFEGFLPKRKGKRGDRLSGLEGETGTLIIYESPKRILRLLDEVIEMMGDRRGVLCREMTKPYEEFIRGRISEIRAELKRRKTIKGEITLLISGKAEKEKDFQEAVREEIKGMLIRGKKRPAEISREIADKYGCSKKQVYEQILAEQAKKS